MKRVTVSLEPEHLEMLEERDESSRSEALRAVLGEYEELRTEYEELHTECERLRNEKRTILDQREEHGELVKYAEQERTYREAGLLTRARWWAFGMNDDGDG
jgi:metal-responsive CopG/Arc/MetJ family transcriptional regulator